MTSRDIFEKYLTFFQKQKHRQIPNHSLVPDGDSTLLFVNSGMFPLVPYFSGLPHPMGKRLVNIQRSLRFEDIDEIGDSRHTTCFHMLGNWSLGDYFKKEQLGWFYEFLITVLKLDPKKLFATVFAGDEHAPKDEESIKILQTIFQKYQITATVNSRIYPADRKNNWWQRGEAIGELGGPDSETFYYLGKGSGESKNPTQNQDEFLEIGNSVFMQYQKTETGWKELPQKNVDFGGGLERIALVVQNKKDIFETDNFWPIILELQKLSGKKYQESPEITRAMRILADHLRTATFIAMDKVAPANKDQGYILRRFLRRIIRFGKKLGIENNLAVSLLPTISDTFFWLYPNLKQQIAELRNIFQTEENRFQNTLKKAEIEVQKKLKGTSALSPKEAGKMSFIIFQSTGYPPELFLEDLQEKKFPFEKDFVGRFYDQFNHELKLHQAESKVGAEQKFKGGLADHSEQVIKYHTATHLLHQALRQVLGKEVAQQGSNITGERLRFDFTYPSPLTEGEIKQVENIVNQKIQAKLPVNFTILEKAEAEESGALHFFKEKYPDQVKVYYIGNSLETAFSKEYCAGPHIKNLSALSPTFHIYKQEGLGKGVRRVYGKFEDNSKFIIQNSKVKVKSE